ncbi:hypothetical protein BGZ63DRAFT_388298 [Mariannaea sp. PMI_226]|nr:hypothetical protein BGZ63DRAFT_388298 [Mariannaea sp. PMI_226]
MCVGGLLQLPNEILFRICFFLCDHCVSDTGWPSYSGEGTDAHNHDLHRLVLTCKRLHDAATPFLYHHPRAKCLARLTRTIAAHPSIARSVQWLDNHQSGTEWLGHGEYSRWVMAKPVLEGGEEELAELEAAAQRIGLELPENWAGSLPMQLNCIMDILLAHLPNITALSFKQWHCWDVGRLLGTSHKLGSVKKMAVGFLETHDGFDFAMDANLLAATPNLETLEVRMCTNIPFLGYSLTKLHALFIRDCVLSAKSLRNLINACPILETFAYDSSMTIFDRTGGEVRRDILEKILRTRRHTLRYLDISMGRHYGFRQYNIGGDFWKAHFNSFADFTVLETIILHPGDFDTDGEKLNHESACRLANALPPSVRVLAISTGLPGLDKLFPILATAIYQNRLPRLKVVFTTNFKQAGKILQPVGVICMIYDAMMFDVLQKMVS